MRTGTCGFATLASVSGRLRELCVDKHCDFSAPHRILLSERWQFGSNSPAPRNVAGRKVAMGTLADAAQNAGVSK
jgi:hypothetical protein